MDNRALMKAPDVLDRDDGDVVGSKVFSKINHGKIKVGDLGTIVGHSSNGDNYIIVKFGSTTTTLYNLLPSQVSKTNPLHHADDLGGSSLQSSFEKLGLGSSPNKTDITTSMKGVDEYDDLGYFFGSKRSHIIPNTSSLGNNSNSSVRRSLADIRASFGSSIPSAEVVHQEQEQVEDGSDTLLKTEDVTLISHAHGRQRRAERKIQRVELQAAIKHGTRESANPGRDGSTRWRYTHNGVVYITDETSRHEVTSWRIDGADDGEDEEEIAPAQVELAGSGCHAVLIIDNSGSMRASDVPGFESRAKAVYDCLKRDFAKEQLKTGAAKDVVVTLISMSKKATVLIDRKPLDESIIQDLERISKQRPRSHGNYIPALDKALDVMKADAANRSSVLLLFFSDGAPSDQQHMLCEHNIPIFQIDRKAEPLMQHRSKGSAWNCRKKILEKVNKECCQRVKRIGQVFGRDKVILQTLAFGPPRENFSLLEEMAGVLPRGEFHKLGLNAAKLKTAFSSLSSSLLTLRTEGGHRALTRRSDKVVDKNQKIDPNLLYVTGEDGWWIYAFEDFIGKYEFCKVSEESSGKLNKTSLSGSANGMAFHETPFAEGAERFVYRCTEIYALRSDYYDAANYENAAQRLGLRFVAKEAKDVENHHQGRKFHETFARIQSDAASFAQSFTKRLSYPRDEWSVMFIKTCIYGCRDENYKNGKAWILVEPELDGKFTKWNNNAGEVRGNTSSKIVRPQQTSNNFTMGSMAVLEESDEENEDSDDDDVAPIEIDDIPQAFSHFTYEHSQGRKLVCDLQGVWNADDGFVLTDPVVHYVCPKGETHKNGATDKGLTGVKKFFETHVCNSLCKKMNLPPRTPSSLGWH